MPESSDISASDWSDATESKKPHKCSFSWCKAAYSKAWKLVVHMRKHSGERPFECDIEGCKKTYTNAAHLKRHKVLSHEKGDEIVCEHEGCGKVFNNRYSLRKHINIKHKDGGAFVCSECHVKFDKKKQLQEHFYVHTGIKPFKCDLCEKEYATEREYIKHKRNHKTYECECGEIFSRWTLYLAHRREVCKPVYKCIICDKLLSSTSSLKQHSLTHVEESNKKKFVCEYEGCSRSYDYQKNLTQHINLYHLKKFKIEKCPYDNCGAELKSRRNLKQHIKIVHETVKVPKPRKPRCDIGIKKKPMISVLTGIDVSKEEKRSILQELSKVPREMKKVREIEKEKKLKYKKHMKGQKHISKKIKLNDLSDEETTKTPEVSDELDKPVESKTKKVKMTKEEKEEEMKFQQFMKKQKIKLSELKNVSSSQVETMKTNNETNQISSSTVSNELQTDKTNSDKDEQDLKLIQFMEEYRMKIKERQGKLVDLLEPINVKNKTNNNKKIISRRKRKSYSESSSDSDFDDCSWKSSDSEEISDFEELPDKDSNPEKIEDCCVEVD